VPLTGENRIIVKHGLQACVVVKNPDFARCWTWPV
jgi:hypothetical protein